MKAVFGILGLVIVLAIVASLAKTQSHAIGGGASTGRNTTAAAKSGAFAPGGAGALTVHPGAIAADLGGATVPQQARAIGEHARAETARALEQGAERNRRADP